MAERLPRCSQLMDTERRRYPEMGPHGPNAITRILVRKSQESHCQRKPGKSHTAGFEDEGRNHMSCNVEAF